MESLKFRNDSFKEPQSFIWNFSRNSFDRGKNNRELLTNVQIQKPQRPQIQQVKNFPTSGEVKAIVKLCER